MSVNNSTDKQCWLATYTMLIQLGISKHISVSSPKQF